MGSSIGTPEQWEPIFQRHPGLMDALKALIEYSPAATKPVALSSDAHRIVFGLRNVCIEECWEILLLAAHSYEKGATKLLRGFYERAVTLCYLIKFPEKAKNFIAFGYIQEHKLISAALKILSHKQLNRHLAPSSIEIIESAYQQHRPEFLRTKCKKCDSKELKQGWDVDIPTMAERLGPPFPQLLLSAYIVPTLLLHTTMASTWSRVTSDAGRHTFSYTPNPQQIDSCIFYSLSLIAIVHRATSEFFDQPLEGVINLEQMLIAHFQTWGVQPEVASDDPAS
jgi:hypothetical protein